MNISRRGFLGAVAAAPLADMALPPKTETCKSPWLTQEDLKILEASPDGPFSPDDIYIDNHMQFVCHNCTSEVNYNGRMG